MCLDVACDTINHGFMRSTRTKKCGRSLLQRPRPCCGLAPSCRNAGGGKGPPKDILSVHSDLEVTQSFDAVSQYKNAACG